MTNDTTAVSAVENPFENQSKQTTLTSSGEREVATIRAQMVLARQFPRDPRQAADRILDACTDVALASESTYLYNRGGQAVSGPSIRLAECMAREWGNIEYGVRELERAPHESIVEAFAWDLETNTRDSKTFAVPHVRYARGKTSRLTDPRDIYEAVANQAARRQRACILAIIPKQVIEAAVRQCELTLENSQGAAPEALDKMVEAFERFGVTREQIARRLGKSFDAALGADVVRFRQIYQSIADGISKPDAWFPPVESATSEGAQALDAAIAGGAS